MFTFKTSRADRISNACLFSEDSYCLFYWRCHNMVVRCDLLFYSAGFTSVRANRRADFISGFTDIKRSWPTDRSLINFQLISALLFFVWFKWADTVLNKTVLLTSQKISKAWVLGWSGFSLPRSVSTRGARVCVRAVSAFVCCCQEINM